MPLHPSGEVNAPVLARLCDDLMSRQRWLDAQKRTYALGYHEVPFDSNGQIVKGERVLPENLPGDADPVLTAFHNYYRTPSRWQRTSKSSPRARPKELVIVPDADHVDLYDNLEKIPFDKLEVFFKQNPK